MDVVWKVGKRFMPWRCPFEYDNPVPEPPCDCYDEEEVCPCCRECYCERSEWRAVIECNREVQVRVQLADGSYAECCSPEAHGLPVQWWSPVYVHPHFIKQPSPGERLLLESVDRMYKYMYRDSRIEELAGKPPAWQPSSDVSFKYGVVEIDLASDDD